MVPTDCLDLVLHRVQEDAFAGMGWMGLTWDRVKTFTGIAGPVALNSLMSNLSGSCISLIAAKMGSDVIAANAVVSGLWGLLWALFWGFGCATQVRVANHLGANRPKAAKALGWMGFGCTAASVLGLALATFLLREKVFEVYTSDDDLLKLCMLAQPVFILAFLISSIEILNSAILTAMGQVQVTAWTSSLTTWFVELPFAYIVGVVMNVGFLALWFGIVIIEVIRLTVYLVTLARIDWSEMARKAMKTMEVTQDNEVEVELESMRCALSEAGNTPQGYNTALRSPMTRMTPGSRRDTYERVDGEVRRRAGLLTPKQQQSRTKSYHV